MEAGACYERFGCPLKARNGMAAQWDVFISHVFEDKESFVRPLAEALRQLGVSVWYDEFSLHVGDSLSRGIDLGIGGSKFGVVVISTAFIGKNWPEHELRGLVNRDVEDDFRILPIWHGVTKSDVKSLSPSLAVASHGWWTFEGGVIS
jgi:hypothetical protein